jgi:HEAT repeat protein
MKLRRFIVERKPHVIVVLVAGFTILAGGILVLLLPPEPRYRGRPLTYWLEGWYPYPPSLVRSRSALSQRDWTARRSAAEAAVRALGTNALPVLIRMLARRDGPLKRRLVNTRIAQRLVAHGTLASFLTPAWKRTRTAAQMLGLLGPAARAAVPALLAVLKGCPDLETRRCAVVSLGEIGPGAAVAVPALTRMAILPADAFAHEPARDALRLIGMARTNGFLVALEYEHSTNPEVQTAASVVLNVVDPGRIYGKGFEGERSGAANGSQPGRPPKGQPASAPGSRRSP